MDRSKVAHFFLAHPVDRLRWLRIGQGGQLLAQRLLLEGGL